jgi:hypothetical protein
MMQIKNNKEIRSITEIYNFRQAPVVGVPIPKVANTLAQWLHWMASSYVGRLDTKNDLLEVGVPQIPRSFNTEVSLGPTNLVGCPRCVNFRGRCALVALSVFSGHPEFYVGNNGLPEGCAPSGPANYLWVLGRF